jgi:hypothetical protein
VWCMEVSWEVDAAGPPWRPSESTAFLPFAAAAAAGDRAGASLSGRRNGLAARSSNLSSVRKRPVRFLHLPLLTGLPKMLA